MTALAIEVEGLHKRFGDHVVLDGIDLSVTRGEVFALLGPNGAGKTTAINILTTLTKPDSGRVAVGGFDVRAHPVAVQQRISLTGQSAAVDDALTATENVVMFARLSGLGRAAARRRCVELLERFGLADAASRAVRTYSGGMRRRLDLALSFVVTPEILFLDEPTTGLDTRSRRDLWDIIRAMADAGTTVFLTTQYLEEADQLADRIAVLHDGRIAALGTADQLKSRVGGDTVEVHDAHGELLREIATDGTLPGLRRALDQLDEQGAEGTVTLRRPTLDDVFLALTGTTSRSGSDALVGAASPKESA
ncbi:ATP-binding cassette domain-containing protein [Microbacterium sp. M28]|uniref:ATP-binding cassette domain-containing protein n=1 Tax=Microbacterium sp. M28 TaxID=2962064 RepID=UPI0021F49D82|nr:ATP-binding cassette domain-containing protein [Microbacterium sp. M28]UYO96454.1 ATP-binding cassette domain-containing protein [Microbacterium sp. M28]